MKISKRGYIRRFVKLFILKTGLSYQYAKLNAEYFAEEYNSFLIGDVRSDVNDCIADHIC